MPTSKVRARARKKALKARIEKQSDQSTCRDACCPPRPQSIRPR